MLPSKPGQCERYDYEYRRNGVANLFMFVEQQAGWLHVEVIAQHTKLEFAHQMKCLVEERYPEAEDVRITLDNLNTPLDSHQSHCPSQKSDLQQLEDFSICAKLHE